jgi:hypothetical protein
MDTAVAFTMIDTIEAPMILIFYMINIFQILPYYIPVGIIHIILTIIWYFYCKNGIIQTKLLDLKTKSPVF